MRKRSLQEEKKDRKGSSRENVLNVLLSEKRDTKGIRGPYRKLRNRLPAKARSRKGEKGGFENNSQKKEELPKGGIRRGHGAIGRGLKGRNQVGY